MLVIEHCAHPLYRDALKRGSQTPHRLDKAFEMHLRLDATGSMLPPGASELAASASAP